MAQRKRKKKKKGGFPLKMRILAAAWVCIVIGIIVLVGNYIFANEFSTETPKEYDADALTRVELSPGCESYMIDYTAHRVYFDSKRHVPYAVSYELLADETDGTVPRHKNFENDPSVVGCAYPQDYTRSGYDRGHMAPAGDMKFDYDAMHDSFKMTNICPQNKSLNTGVWNALEMAVRQWAQRDSALIVVCGPIFHGTDTTTIGTSRVGVPGAFFKVILAPHASPARAIGFIMPNERCSGKYKSYAVSVDSVEAASGFDFFAALPDDVENSVEAQCNIEAWLQH